MSQTDKSADKEYIRHLLEIGGADPRAIRKATTQLISAFQTYERDIEAEPLPWKLQREEANRLVKAIDKLRSTVQQLDPKIRKRFFRGLVPKVAGVHRTSRAGEIRWKELCSDLAAASALASKRANLKSGRGPKHQNPALLSLVARTIQVWQVATKRSFSTTSNLSIKGRPTAKSAPLLLVIYALKQCAGIPPDTSKSTDIDDFLARVDRLVEAAIKQLNRRETLHDDELWETEESELDF